MNDNPVHDLLDSVSSGQPHPHRLSVDDLVRAGRHRQRRVASGVAGGTAAVVALATVVASQSPFGTTQQLGAESAGSGSPDGPTVGPTLSPASYYPPPTPFPSSWPIVNGPAGASVAISGILVLNGGETLRATLLTDECAGPASLSDQESPTEVLVTLRLSASPPSAPADGNTCGPRPTVLVTEGEKPNTVGGEVLLTLKSPLGKRTVVDATTGHEISTVIWPTLPEPTHLPPGFAVDVTAAAENGHTEFRSGRELLTLDQLATNDQSLGHPANAVIGVTPAYFADSGGVRQLTWWRSGRRFQLSVSASTPCTAAGDANTSPGPLVSCGAAALAPTNPADAVSQQELLAVAASVTP